MAVELVEHEMQWTEPRIDLVGTIFVLIFSTRVCSEWTLSNAVGLSEHSSPTGEWTHFFSSENKNKDTKFVDAIIANVSD